MRLSRIKLSGFKSFLEPITLSFDTPLTGIAGPNGCGKSNIVDAIRWVIGESSAKQLRGETLSDVIFSGSLNRKSVGKAHVELIFDNQLKKLGGRFSEYSEISIKREITREGGSHYFLNQTSCRRRDIMDVLLGTGLGPRSYAVIEQGMISHLISATPDELRGYLEEAAMVSKYKEQRKEAESRIANTRENINRINDLSIELNVQLDKVELQARTAGIYKTWKAELELATAQIEALEINQLQKKVRQNEAAILEKESRLAILLQCEAQTGVEEERLYSALQQQTVVLSKEQDEYYRFKMEVTRLEQSLKDIRQQNNRLQESIKQFDHNKEVLNRQLAQDQKQLQAFKRQQSENEPLLSLKMSQLDIYQSRLSETQAAWHLWQQQWDLFNKVSQQTRQSLEIKKNQLQQARKLTDSYKQQQKQFSEEKQQLEQESFYEQSTQWEVSLDHLTSQIEVIQIQIQSLDQEIHAERQKKAEWEVCLNNKKGEIQTLQAERLSLKKLQELALGEGKFHRATLEWLKQNGHDVTYFMENIHIEPGWEKALEVVIQELLGAFYVENIEELAKAVILKNGLCFIEKKEMAAPLSPSKDAGKHLLIEKISCIHPMFEFWLSNIYLEETLEEALKKTPLLNAYESIITRDGVWLGASWVKMPQTQDERSGILIRRQRIQVLTEELQVLQQALLQLEKGRKTNLERLQLLNQEREKALEDQRKKMDEKTQTQARLEAKKAYVQKNQARLQRIENALETLEEQIRRQQDELQDLQKNIEILRGDFENHQQEEGRLQAQKRDLNHGFEMAKSELKNAEHQVNHLKSLIDSAQKQSQFLDKQILRTEEQIQGIDQQRSLLGVQLKEIEESVPRQESDWQAFMEKCQIGEVRLKQIKAEHQEMEDALHLLKKNVHEKKLEIDQTRKALERLRIDQGSSHAQLANHEEQVKTLGFELETLLNNLSKDARKSQYVELKVQLQKNIQSLGEINLAATAEYEALKKRKTYLDEQSEDLRQGLNMLEEAIRKIDQETCVQLKNTFEQVNQNFMNLFAKIFEGGQACLELTESNWLSTGIVVKAQPRGKRNTTIHLLSGGEKALTAIALVFALFQLNPAPFCVLDEVDAPLDDHNIARFCKLVEEMAQTLQFIFISHSKAALTMAKQLVGVTMREPGVSRIVSVNVEEAVKFLA